ncbi:recombinase family protein [Desulfofustis glycolicus]|uniref:Recombinase n=1 Tax=Desulfofustis glycolicus DSM 9705 TaxID=1121409 RepID=A0A1M5XDV4_9BACT|nr:recombinase family protein [Desulfofustis glycolicus]SHH97383.1 Recombinase [Desulfofustis glycolicus DSM 9705]
MEGRFVCYYRVSTDRQGNSGLGLDAQRQTVMDYLNGGHWEMVSEYTEVESGGKDDRPALKKAIRDCRLKNARLVVAKLDRLSRDLHFITSLSKAGVNFVIAEQPDMNELTVHIFSAMAQHERKLISQRTKAALEQAKKRGVKLGNPCFADGKQIPGSGDTSAAREAKLRKAVDYAKSIREVIEDIGADKSLRQIAQELNSRGFKTIRGKDWSSTAVLRILKR